MCYIMGGFVVPWAMCMPRAMGALNVLVLEYRRSYSIELEASWQADLFGLKMSTLVGLLPPPPQWATISLDQICPGTV